MVITLPGPSVEELKQKQTELNALDLCYATVNDFWAIEEYFHRCDIVFCSAVENLVPRPQHFEFLERKDDNLFITEFSAFEDLAEFDKCIDKYNDKMLFIITDKEGIYPSYEGVGLTPDQPLHFITQPTFSILITLMMIGGASMIVLFGADGGNMKNGNLYFVSNWGGRTRMGDSWGRIAYDAKVLNQMLPDMLQQACDLYQIKQVKILNCSPDTTYEVFETVSYDNIFGILEKACG